jgi:hypothetical protein
VIDATIVRANAATVKPSNGTLNAICENENTSDCEVIENA